MGTAASVPKEQKAKSLEHKSSAGIGGDNSEAASSSPFENAAHNSVEKNVALQQADSKIISPGKLRKMALGQQGYKEQHRDYDKTMNTLELNHTAQMQWSNPNPRSGMDCEQGGGNGNSLRSRNSNSNSNSNRITTSTRSAGAQKRSLAFDGRRDDVDASNHSSSTASAIHREVMAPSALPPQVVVADASTRSGGSIGSNISAAQGRVGGGGGGTAGYIDNADPYRKRRKGDGLNIQLPGELSNRQSMFDGDLPNSVAQLPISQQYVHHPHSANNTSFRNQFTSTSNSSNGISNGGDWSNSHIGGSSSTVQSPPLLYQQSDAHPQAQYAGARPFTESSIAVAQSQRSGGHMGLRGQKLVARPFPRGSTATGLGSGSGCGSAAGELYEDDAMMASFATTTHNNIDKSYKKPDNVPMLAIQSSNRVSPSASSHHGPSVFHANNGSSNRGVVGAVGGVGGGGGVAGSPPQIMPHHASHAPLHRISSSTSGAEHGVGSPHQMHAHAMNSHMQQANNSRTHLLSAGAAGGNRHAANSAPPSIKGGGTLPNTGGGGGSGTPNGAGQTGFFSPISVNALSARPAAGTVVMSGPLSSPGPVASMAFPTVVKETKEVNRNRAQIPTKLTHAKPTTGDWLNKRYIVNNYILLEKLGTGSYGEVRLCKDRTTDKLFAIKIISKDFLKKKKGGKTSETYFEDIKREIAIMKKLHHPNVLKLFEVLDDPKVNKMYLVLEYMKMGDLINILKSRAPSTTDGQAAAVSMSVGAPLNGSSDNNNNNNKSNNGNSTAVLGSAGFTPLNDVEVWNIFRQVVLGVKYLHFQNVIHGDIKPQNLLLSEDGIVKIADFGISQMLHKSTQKIADAAGTPAFMSPELCEQKSFSGQLADVWAIGVTMYMLRYGFPPFVAKTVIALYSKIVNDPLVFPTMIDPGLRNLLEHVLEKDPTKRFTLQQILMHPWMRLPPSGSFNFGHSQQQHHQQQPQQFQQQQQLQQRQGASPLHRGIGIGQAKTAGGSNGRSAGATQPSQTRKQQQQQQQQQQLQPDTVTGLGAEKDEGVGGRSGGLSFMPPAGYDEQEAEAMKAPLKTVDNDEIYQSIGVTLKKKNGKKVGAGSGSTKISSSADEGRKRAREEEEEEEDFIDVEYDSDSDSADCDADNDDKKRAGKAAAADGGGGGASIAAKKAGVQRFTENHPSVDHHDVVTKTGGSALTDTDVTTVREAEEQERNGRAGHGAEQGKTNDSVHDGEQDLHQQTDTDMMATNWGADVFEMVDDGGDLSDSEDEDGDGDDDVDREEKDDQATDLKKSKGSNINSSLGSENTACSEGGQQLKKKASVHSEMSQEEEARRSKRFIGRISKKSAGNMSALTGEDDGLGVCGHSGSGSGGGRAGGGSVLTAGGRGLLLACGSDSSADLTAYTNSTPCTDAAERTASGMGGGAGAKVGAKKSGPGYGKGGFSSGMRAAVTESGSEDECSPSTMRVNLSFREKAHGKSSVAGSSQSDASIGNSDHSHIRQDSNAEGNIMPVSDVNGASAGANGNSTSSSSFRSLVKKDNPQRRSSSALSRDDYGEPNEISMEEFENMMDTLAMQHPRNRKKNNNRKRQKKKTKRSHGMPDSADIGAVSSSGGSRKAGVGSGKKSEQDGKKEEEEVDDDDEEEEEDEYDDDEDEDEEDSEDSADEEGVADDDGGNVDGGGQARKGTRGGKKKDDMAKVAALNASKAAGFSAHLRNAENGVAAAFHSEKGMRPSQEDRCVLLPCVASMRALTSGGFAFSEDPKQDAAVREQLQKFTLACVFDGHSGWRCSQYLSQHLPGLLVTHDKFLEGKHIEKAIMETCSLIDAEICNILREEDDSSGSTGVIAIYDGRKHVFTVAGVGDSMCVLSRGGRAVTLNKMHRLDVEAERERVKKAGGVIINNRVNGILAISRAFGDTQFKQPTQTQTQTENLGHSLDSEDSMGQLVVAEPEVHSEVITPMTEFGIIASDGLWDVINPQAAVSFVRSKLTKSKDLQVASRDLVLEAIKRGSVDNVTALLISFHTPNAKAPPSAPAFVSSSSSS